MSEPLLIESGASLDLHHSVTLGGDFQRDADNHPRNIHTQLSRQKFPKVREGDMSVYFPTYSAQYEWEERSPRDAVLVNRAVVVFAADLSNLTYLCWKSPPSTNQSLLLKEMLALDFS